MGKGEHHEKTTGNPGRGIGPLAGMAALSLLLAGCAATPRVLVSAGGDLRQCPPRGAPDCIAGAKSAGYVEREQVGGIGVTVAEDFEAGKGLKILAVVPGSPASDAGIVSGDFLVRIKGQEVRGKREARMLMFGRAGTRVEIAVRKRGRTVTITLVRQPLEKLKKAD